MSVAPCGTMQGSMDTGMAISEESATKQCGPSLQASSGIWDNEMMPQEASSQSRDVGQLQDKLLHFSNKSMTLNKKVIVTVTK